MTFQDHGIRLKIGARGNVKTTCPKCSASRKKPNDPCLSVDVDRGMWFCHNCGWKGGLAPEQARKQYRKPDWNPVSTLGATTLAFLAERGITGEIAARNRLSDGPVWFPQVEGKAGAIHFPYLRNGEVVNVKYRSREKHFRLEKDCELIFYGYDDIGETTIITEGEFDKLACEVAGFPNAISVPNGASCRNMEYLENSELGLQRVKTFILAVDNDEPGQKLEAELARRLGAEKCLRVVWPKGCKDANDVLLQHGPAKLGECIAKAQPFPIDGVFVVTDCLEQLSDMHENGIQAGTPTGWVSVDENYRPRIGEFTVVTGIPGHGKSEFIDALCVNLAVMFNWRVAFCSPENQPIARHMVKILEKHIGKPFNRGKTERMEMEEIKRENAWLDDHFFFFSVTEDNTSIDSILGRARQLVFQKGIKGLVIDPWNQLEHKRDGQVSETEYISQCLTRFGLFARNNGVHLWIVAHPAKMRKDLDGKYPVPTPYDISGSAHWANKADMCLTVWRDVMNREKPVEIHIQKVRFKENGGVGVVRLEYDRVTGRYFDLVKPVTHSEHELFGA